MKNTKLVFIFFFFFIGINSSVFALNSDISFVPSYRPSIDSINLLDEYVQNTKLIALSSLAVPVSGTKYNGTGDLPTPEFGPKDSFNPAINQMLQKFSEQNGKVIIDIELLKTADTNAYEDLPSYVSSEYLNTLDEETLSNLGSQIAVKYDEALSPYKSMGIIEGLRFRNSSSYKMPAPLKLQALWAEVMKKLKERGYDNLILEVATTKYQDIQSPNNTEDFEDFLKVLKDRKVELSQIQIKPVYIPGPKYQLPIYNRVIQGFEETVNLIKTRGYLPDSGLTKIGFSFNLDMRLELIEKANDSSHERSEPDPSGMQVYITSEDFYYIWKFMKENNTKYLFMDARVLRDYLGSDLTMVFNSNNQPEQRKILFNDYIKSIFQTTIEKN